MTYEELLALESQQAKKINQDDKTVRENMEDFAKFIKENKCRIKEDNS